MRRAALPISARPASPLRPGRGRGPHLAVVGSGIAGLSVAFRLARAGARCEVYERGSLDLRHACSFAAGGMLAPVLELDVATVAVSRAGERALTGWERIAAALGRADLVRRTGSLAVAHPRDAALLDSLERRVRRQRPEVELRRLGRPEIHALEPQLQGRFERALFAPNEGHLDPREVLPAMVEGCRREGVVFHERAVAEPLPGAVGLGRQRRAFEWVVDCRGTSAAGALPGLRGVRGEALLLHARDVALSRPVRLAHPRYPLYVVPRADRRYLVGATSIESDDAGPVSARSVLELLSAAYALAPGFAEARLLETLAHVRPAFPDNEPRVSVDGRLVRVNGLYRHGYLLAPVLAEAVAAMVLQEPMPQEVRPWISIATAADVEMTR